MTPTGQVPGPAESPAGGGGSAWSRAAPGGDHAAQTWLRRIRFIGPHQSICHGTGKKHPPCPLRGPGRARLDHSRSSGSAVRARQAGFWPVLSEGGRAEEGSWCPEKAVPSRSAAQPPLTSPGDVHRDERPAEAEGGPGADTPTRTPVNQAAAALARAPEGPRVWPKAAGPALGFCPSRPVLRSRPQPSCSESPSDFTAAQAALPPLWEKSVGAASASRPGLFVFPTRSTARSGPHPSL